MSKSRSQAIEAAATSAAAPERSPAPAASTQRASAKAPQALCAGQLEGEGKPLPKKPMSRRGAAGSEGPSRDLGASPAGFTWVNFWAAWCVPCREEIPRLTSWDQKLGARLEVAFVSLDDDERQLEQFLNAQPPAGLRATYWLKEGKEREDWLTAAAVDPDPELPLHLLVDPRGRVRCTVQGAVEDSDFEAVRALVSR